MISCSVMKFDALCDEMCLYTVADDYFYRYSCRVCFYKLQLVQGKWHAHISKYYLYFVHMK